MLNLILVGLGGGLGAILRHLVSVQMSPLSDSLSVGTLVVNIIGCFVGGFLLGREAAGDALSSEMRLLVITGFLGGFTTYSAFGVESLALLRDPATLTLGLGYILVQVVSGLVAAAAGFYLASRS